MTDIRHIKRCIIIIIIIIIIETWTGLPMEESVRMTEDRDKWRKYVHGVCNYFLQCFDAVGWAAGRASGL